MKRFLTGVAEWKTGACLMYTGSTILYMAVLYFLQAQPELGFLFSLLLASALGSFIQYLAFTDRVIPHLRYSLRMLLFVGLFFPMLTACAFLFQWFPMEQVGSWLIFILIFLAIFLAMSAGFEVYFRLTGRKYDGILGQYKKRQEERE